MSHTPPVDSKGAAIKLVKILKELQLDTMAVESVDKGDWDSDVEYLTDKLHWAEVQILALLAQEVNRARKDELKEIQMADDLSNATKDVLYGCYIKDRIKDLERLG